MNNLRGFLWSMGRSGTKAIIETINDHTDADQLSWVDTPRFIEAPGYFFSLYPRPFGLTLHVAHHTAQYETMLRQRRSTPVIFAVRDPIPHLKSYARVFLNSYIGRRIDGIIAHTRAGNTVVDSINPVALEKEHLPTIDYWRHWNTIKHSPNKIVDFSDLRESRFVETMTEVCDLFGLQIKRPINWAGIANTESDSFIINYMREFPILGRKFNLRFTRWNSLWSEPGLVTLGTLRSSLLDGMIGPGGSLYVQAKAEHLLTYGGIEREREAMSTSLNDQETRDNFAAVILEDYNAVSNLVNNELETFQNILIKQYELMYRDGIDRFLREHPALREKWSRAAVQKAA